MKQIRTVIADDERLARARLTRLLERRDDIEIAGVARDGNETVAMIAELQPDLLLLDIQMPMLSGFEVLAAAGNKRPFVIFTTAYDDYALQAFEVHALDYLLKPFDAERLDGAVTRAVQMIRGVRRGNGAASNFLHPLAPPRRFVIRSAGRILFLPLAEVDWIEAADNYVYLHCGRQKHLMRGSIKTLDEQLRDTSFVRIQRSTIVNSARVRQIVPQSHGDCEVVLASGASLSASRTYAPRLREVMSVSPRR